MILAYKNYIKDSTLTANTEDLNQNIDNLKIPQLSKGFQFNNNLGNIIMSFPSAKNLKSCIIDIGTMDQECVVTIKGSTVSDNWGDAPFVQTLVTTGSCVYGFFDETYQYWLIDFVDVSQQVKIKIGYIFVGDWLQMPPMSQDAGIYYETTTQNTMSISGQQYSDRGIQFVSTAFDFPRIFEDEAEYFGKTVAGRKQILAAWRETEFQYCWLFLWESSLEHIPPIFGSMEKESIEFERVRGQDIFWSLSFKYKEIK